MPTIPLMVPDLPDADALLPWLRQIDANRWYTNFGPLVQEFEKTLAEILRSDRSVASLVTTSNATVALELCLEAMDLPKGAHILVPGLTFVASATAIARAGFTPVIADVDPDSWLLTPQIATRALAQFSSIDAVMPVAAFGCPQNTEAWQQWRQVHGLPVIIDAAGAIGNQPIGDIPTVFSLHATKSLGVGEGGVIASTDAAWLERVRRLTNFGLHPDHGVANEAGTNGKMSEYHAAVGLAAIPHWIRRRPLRTRLYRTYQEYLQHYCPAVRLQAKPEGVPALLPVALPEGMQATAVAAGLARAEIATRRWYCPPLYAHPAFAHCPTAGGLENCRSLGERLLGLPFHLQLSHENIKMICTQLARCMASLSVHHPLPVLQAGAQARTWDHIGGRG